MGFRLLGFGLWVLGFGLWVLGCGFRCYSLAGSAKALRSVGFIVVAAAQSRGVPRSLCFFFEKSEEDGIEVQGLGFGVQGLGVQGLRFRGWGA